MSIKDSLKSIKGKTVKSFVEDKLSSEKFSDEQRGLIKGWLSDAVDVGFELGRREAVVDANPELLNKIFDKFTDSLGIGDADNKNEQLKLLVYKHRSIVHWLLMTLSSYDGVVDELMKESPLLKLKLPECLGVCGVG